jgi:hypothetical protein
MIIDPQFLDEFDLWFNADTIRFDDKQKMIYDAIALGDTIVAWGNAFNILSQLDYVINNRQPSEVIQFINKTNIDWYADESMSALLLEILTAIHGRLSLSVNGQT